MRSYIVPAYAYVKHDDTTYIHGKINIAAAANSQQACTAAQQQQYRIHTRHITLHYVEQLVAV